MCLTSRSLVSKVGSYSVVKSTHFQLQLETEVLTLDGHGVSIHDHIYSSYGLRQVHKLYFIVYVWMYMATIICKLDKCLSLCHCARCWHQYGTPNGRYCTPCDMLPIVCSTTTRDYQISLINQEALIQGVFICCVLNWPALAILMSHNRSRPKYRLPYWTRRVLTSICPPPPRWINQHLPASHWASRDPLLPASIKVLLSSQEALLQEVSISCMLDWLTLSRAHPFNPVSQWSTSLWKPQNTSFILMDNSFICTLNMLEVKPSRTKCVQTFVFVYNF